MISPNIRALDIHPTAFEDQMSYTVEVQQIKKYRQLIILRLFQNIRQLKQPCGWTSAVCFFSAQNSDIPYRFQYSWLGPDGFVAEVCIAFLGAHDAS